MTAPVSRRRFLTMSAATAAAAAAGSLPSARAAGAEFTRWRGQALGAAASLRIAGLAPRDAAPILHDVQRELSRLEAVFSLHQERSALARLNRDGRLDLPPPELLEVLSLSDRLHRATGGAFDPTVQPLFALHARAALAGIGPTPAERAVARAAVGWDAVRFDTRSVRLERKGAALTLNGIAQGYITDRIAGLLASRGLTDILVDMGEIAARGARPDGGAWRAAVAAPGGRVLRRMTLSDRALATSAPLGTVLDPAGRIGHIFDPGEGGVADAAAVVAVSADTAALADGLSTALCAMPADRAADTALAGFPDARIEVRVP